MTHLKQIEEMKEFYSEPSVPGKTPICLLHNMCAISSRCIFISLMLYYIKGHNSFENYDSL